MTLSACLLSVVPTPQARATERRSWASLIEGARFVRRQPVVAIAEEAFGAVLQRLGAVSQ